MQVEVEEFIPARGSAGFQRWKCKRRCLLNSRAFSCVKEGAGNDIYIQAQPLRTTKLKVKFTCKLSQISISC